MADPLIEVGDVSVRLGRSFGPADTARAEALIRDVSGEVYSLAGDDAFHDEAGQLDVPDVVVGIVADAVIRAFENPRGLTGETIGDYSYQAGGPGRDAGLYLTAAQRRSIRRAAGVTLLGGIQMETDLPLRGATVFDINTLTG
jgi:hypothetical protein